MFPSPQFTLRKPQDIFVRAEVTGVPVRQAFFDIGKPRERHPTLLVFGGSQGAHAINEAMIQCLPELLKQVPKFTSSIRPESATIMTRRPHIRSRRVGRSFSLHRRHAGFFRAIRSDFVPFGREHGGGNHGSREAGGVCSFSARRRRSSKVNARGAGRAGAAVVVEETKLERVWLADTIAALLGDPARLQRMSEAARSLAHPERGPRYRRNGRAVGGN